MTDTAWCAGGGSAELKLLLACTRNALASDDGEQIALLAGIGIDWERAQEIAILHGMIPLFFWQLNSICPHLVPQPALEHLKSEFTRNAQHNMHLVRELIAVVDSFESEQITCLAYKGPILAENAYKNLALREFLDLDLLIRKSDVSKAVKRLLELGFTPELHITFPHTAPIALSSWTRLTWEHHFLSPKADYILDLHWDLLPEYFSCKMNVDALWHRARWHNLAGRMVRTLAPEDLLLVLCVHGAKHKWSRLHWIVDVAQVLSANPEIDWQLVFETARSVRATRMLLLGLKLADQFCGIALPNHLAEKIASDVALAALLSEVRETIFDEHSRTAELVEHAPFHLNVRENLLDRIRYYLNLTFSPNLNDWALFPLPEWLFPLYCIIRPVRVFTKYWREILRHVSGIHQPR